MSRELSEAELASLRAFLVHQGRREGEAVAAGYQGQIHVFDSGPRRLVIKEALGFGPLSWITRWMLRREYAIYRELGDYPFAPPCYGLIDRRYLVLGLVEGIPFRHAELEDREAFFSTFRKAIRELHARGIAHGDLKRKENLLVIEGLRPCLLDFGTAMIEPKGWAPLRRWLFRTLRQYDVNAWLKLKSNRDLHALPEEERMLYRRSLSEKISRFFKQGYLRLRWGSKGPPKKVKAAPDLGEKENDS